MRFTRNVHFQIKPDKQQEFKKVFDAEIVPLMKKQDGFRHELALVNDRGAVGISLWDDEASAKRYSTETYPKVLDRLKTMIDGTPKVETYNVTTSTLN